MAPLPSFFYVAALVWAIAFAHSAPLLSLIPALVVGVLGFVFHTLGNLDD